MASLFRKATREQAKLRAAFIGPAGAGKTYTALAVGTNLIPGGRVAVIDTECGSAELYAGTFEFDTLALSRHSPLDYVEAIHAAEAEGYDVIVIDSLSHAWIGKDGALEQVDKAAERDPRNNSYTAWRNVTPKHMKLVDTMISCKAHLIATIRAKTEFVQEKNEKTGKTEIRKLGLAPIQRDGLEYEFTLVGDIDLSNQLKISKTRLDGVILPGDIFEKPGASLAKKIYGWLMAGAPSRPTPPAAKPVELAPAPASVTNVEPPAPVSAPSAEHVTAKDEVASFARQPEVAPPATPPPATTSVSDAVDAAFAGWLRGLAAATTIAELDAAAKMSGAPAKGTPNRAWADRRYRERKAAIIEAQGKALPVTEVA